MRGLLTSGLLSHSGVSEIHPTRRAGHPTLDAAGPASLQRLPHVLLWLATDELPHVLVKSATPMPGYNAGHTGPQSPFGGYQLGFASVAYQLSISAS